jgi:hypothetical protein
MLTECKFPHAAGADPRFCRVCGGCDGSLRPEKPALANPAPGFPIQGQEMPKRKISKSRKWDFVLR